MGQGGSDGWKLVNVLAGCLRDETNLWNISRSDLSVWQQGAGCYSPSMSGALQLCAAWRLDVAVQYTAVVYIFQAVEDPQLQGMRMTIPMPTPDLSTMEHLPVHQRGLDGDTSKWAPPRIVVFLLVWL